MIEALTQDHKASRQKGRWRTRQEDLLWTRLSLSWALRGLEDEDEPEYSAEDIKGRDACLAIG